jgi:hypothetical protein
MTNYSQIYCVELGQMVKSEETFYVKKDQVGIITTTSIH